MFLRQLALTGMFATLGVSAVLNSEAQAIKHHTPYDTMESKAELARNLQQESVKAFVHEVLAQPHSYKLPDPISSLLENKLTLAELNFRRRQNTGVTEAQLVTLLNSIHDRLKLPPSHIITAQQVRTLRIKLAIMAPNTMGDTLTGPELKKGDHVHTTMSPLQAMHLMLVMMDQKVANPDYQDPSIDLAARERERQASRNNSTKAALTIEPAETTKKNRQIRSDISAALDSMTLQDAYDMTNQALQTLRLD